jgi:peptidyl-prolyl cis-trans isomerase A (cyclophilin A)
MTIPITLHLQIKFTKNIIHFCLLGVLLLASHASLWAADTITLVMSTSAGDIRIETYPQDAPKTVENFLKYVDSDHYNNASFYRVVRMDNQEQNQVKIEVIQGGMQIESEGLPFEAITHESTQATGIKHLNGVISMARGEPGTAASEFFICVNDQPELDFGGQRNPDGLGFAAFGRVIEGMDVVRTIQDMNTEPPEGELEYTSGQMLLEPVIIYDISRAD